MIVNDRITDRANVNLRLRFSTDLLVDNENQAPAPQQANINAFLNAVSHLGGPMEAAFHYRISASHYYTGGTLLETIKQSVTQSVSQSINQAINNSISQFP